MSTNEAGKLNARIAELETQRDRMTTLALSKHTDAMIAHRFFESLLGESARGRDFAIKVPMTEEYLGGILSNKPALLKALEEVPHTEACASHLPFCSIPEHGHKRCDCWKSRLPKNESAKMSATPRKPELVWPDDPAAKLAKLAIEACRGAFRVYFPDVATEMAELARRYLLETGTRFWISPSGDSITCVKCGLRSHNPNDVKNRYCGSCHEFMDNAL